MVSLSDITALLEKIPLWKRLTTLPDQIRALEGRVAKLESRLAEATGDLFSSIIANGGIHLLAT